MTRPPLEDPDYLVRLVHGLRYGHLERRFCTAEAPMPMALADDFRWSHPDGVVVAHAMGLDVCHCPHCGLSFTCFPRPS